MPAPPQPKQSTGVRIVSGVGLGVLAALVALGYAIFKWIAG